ncbi:hypothetical protein Rsub_11114 [Raphidocelis subcapitata]|uniref:Kinesin motor domain-containing protein n=1 Tax=Raphidocelis subcapitata TaxID=307507 RepID=A0A2V0PJ46_9CHLO|nr:hypothetical protein Rsub_11114 [Raphidocelis subcapitata]|eukprot:GBF98003.1 hypothetical protein Rsub_11114 [Raphidocelis subcapitata]
MASPAGAPRKAARTAAGGSCAGAPLCEGEVNVNVILRCRPPSAQEVADHAAQVLQCNEAQREVHLWQSTACKSRVFRFDQVFGPDSTQAKVYDSAIAPIVEEVLGGYNCTVFAYGQTGTGKTYTMEGGPREDAAKLSAAAGVIPRAIKHIFDAIESNEVTDSIVKVSFLELYNEELTDLLTQSSEDRGGAKLRLLEDRGSVVVQGLEEMVVRNAPEIYTVLDRGSSKRRTAETLLNKTSSRSHSVFTITIHMKETTPGGEDVIKVGKLNLVDLAGSENISRSGAKDGRAREAGNINQSLLTLGRVITALVENGVHVPYRDSKLTRLLRDSLGGRTKTCIIATVGPSAACVDETASTLDYAHRAKNIRNRPEVNQTISKGEMISSLNTEIERLKQDLMATRDKNGIYISAERYEQYSQERAQLRDLTERFKAESEATAASHAEELEATRARAAEAEARLEAKLAAAEGQLADTRAKLAAAEVAIQERDFVVLSHRRSERALAAHAQGVGRDLGEAAKDLSDAFSRLRTALDVTGADRGALRAMASEAAARADALRAAADAAAASQGAALRGVAGAAAELRARKAAELDAARAQLAALQREVSEARRAAEGALASGADAARGAIGELAAPQREALGRAGAAAAGAAERAGGALDALATALDAQARAVSELARAQAADAEACGAAARAAMARASDGLGAAAAAVGAVAGEAGAASATAAETLSAFAASFEARAREREASLLSQIGGLLGAFVSERNGDVAAAVESTRAGLASSDGRVRTAAAAAAAAATERKQALEAERAAVERRVQQQVESLSSAAGRVGKGLGAARSEAACAGAALLSESRELAAQLSRDADALCSSEAAARAAVASGQAAAGAALEEGAGRLGAAAEALRRAADEAATKDEAAAEGVQGAARTAEAAIAGFAREHGEALTATAAALDATARTAMARNPPALPAERAFKAPAAGRVRELVCAPEGALLELFRSEWAAVLERGGDPCAELLRPLTPEAPDAGRDSSGDGSGASDSGGGRDSGSGSSTSAGAGSDEGRESTPLASPRRAGSGASTPKTPAAPAAAGSPGRSPRYAKRHAARAASRIPSPGGLAAPSSPAGGRAGAAAGGGGGEAAF